MKIGIFDSGIGGLGIAREIRRQLPQIDVVYLADWKNFPYGERSDRALTSIVQENTARLRDAGCGLVVIACNTATSVAIDEVRANFPSLAIVGVVPVVKKAAEESRKGKVVVLTTPKTAQSEKYRDLLRRFCQGIAVLTIPAAGLAEAIERQARISHQGGIPKIAISQPRKIEELLDSLLANYRNLGEYDIISLGCTHYPLIRGILRKHFPGARLLDSNTAVARQVKRTFERQGFPRQGRGEFTFLTTS